MSTGLKALSNKLGMAAHTCNSITQKTESKGLKVKASLGYRATSPQRPIMPTTSHHGEESPPTSFFQLVALKLSAACSRMVRPSLWFCPLTGIPLQQAGVLPTAPSCCADAAFQFLWLAFLLVFTQWLWDL